MCRNIRYIRGNAGISIFYDTIFCIGGIYSRGWYLVKRNIAICQIKATAAVAAQQQLHLKGLLHLNVAVTDFHASESLAEHVTRAIDIQAALRCANPTVIRNSRDLKTLSKAFYGTTFAGFDNRKNLSQRSKVNREHYRLHARLSCG